MSSGRQPAKYRKYRPKVISKSAFDDSPTLTINQYRAPGRYCKAVQEVISAYKQDVPFNRAVDQVFALDPKHLNRNKLAEHTLKTIANDY